MIKVTELSKNFLYRLIQKIPVLNTWVHRLIFKNGKDGNMRIGGNTPEHIPSLLQMHRGHAYLQRQAEFKNLSVSKGFTLHTNGYRVYVKDNLLIRGAIGS